MRRSALHLLLVGLLVASAGCSAISGPDEERGRFSVETTVTDTATETTTSTTAVPPTELAVEPTTDDGYNRWIEMYAYEASPARLAREYVPTREKLYTSQRAIATELFANGSADTTAVVRLNGDESEAFRAFDDSEFIRDNGTFYQVNATATTERTGTGYKMRLEGPIREGRPEYETAQEQAVEFEDLPSVDQGLVTFGAPSQRIRDSGSLSTSFRYVFDGDANQSRFLDGETHYVRQDGDLFAIAYRGQSQGAARYAVHYELEPVADSAEAFAADHLDDVVVSLNDSVSEPARSTLVQLAEGGSVDWSGTGQPPENVEAALDWLRTNSVDYRQTFVRYEGNPYIFVATEAVE
ncbi:hypothetical protein [Haloarchaeobius sp. DFWS5]|uniref:hypothetical protein n=1 Tax=Haloarchaeobius sp. DFWS5 TaxID=3446114 RepID=UPI003EBFC9DE